MDDMRRFLDERASEGILRVLSPVEARAGATARLEGIEYVDFSSNDYLAFSSHPRLAQAASSALARYGVGSGASRLMSGDLALHHELERETAAFKGKEAALVFNSGYQANVGIIPAVVARRDAIFADRLCHASIIDGATLSQATLLRFAHNDVEHLESLLRQRRGEFDKALIVTESVFSMDGDLAPLDALCRVKNRYGCAMLVDEAHATGVFGRHGAGRVDEEGVTDEVDFVMGTFSKALGSFGAYLAGSATAVQYLVNTARSFIYSTALPACIIAADLEALKLCREDGGLGKALLEKAAHFRDSLRAQGWEVGGASQIVPVTVGESRRAVDLSAKLAARGLRVLAVRPPTVPKGQARLRFSLSLAHSDDDLRRATEAMRELA